MLHWWCGSLPQLSQDPILLFSLFSVPEYNICIIIGTLIFWNITIVVNITVNQTKRVSKPTTEGAQYDIVCLYTFGNLIFFCHRFEWKVWKSNYSGKAWFLLLLYSSTTEIIYRYFLNTPLIQLDGLVKKMNTFVRFFPYMNSKYDADVSKNRTTSHLGKKITASKLGG